MSSDNIEPPAKRRRLSTDQAEIATMASTSASNILPQPPQDFVSAERKKEVEVGIQAFVNDNTKIFEGVLKQRYSDFLVNEILPNGEVVHLKSTGAPKIKRNHDAQNGAAAPFERKPERHVPPESAAKIDPEDQSRNGQSKREGGSSLPDVSDVDRAKLTELLNEAAANELLSLYQSIREQPRKRSNERPTVRTDFTADRSVRSQIHQFIRDTFKSTIDSSTDHSGVLVLTAANPKSRGNQQGSWGRDNQNRNHRPARLTWADRGGEYCHFTLYKENKDTMEAISWLTKQLKCNARNFQFAGTKDRRAVTSQRCSAYRLEAERLAAQNQTLRGSKIGDFEYQPQGLELGDLGGNEFVITLKNCKIEGQDNATPDAESLKQELDSRMQSLRNSGYLNYYGLQRFGTFSMRTDTIGRYILKEDFGAACNAILSYQQDALEAAQKQDPDSVIGQDDKNRALAIHTWREENRLHTALEILPRKFSAEGQLMRHLTKSSSDYLGGLMQIQRNLRLMYVHAYQSYVWNMAVTNRIKLYGSKVMKGDLVLVNEHKDKLDPSNGAEAATVDADGEQIIEPAGDDRAANEDDVFERARALTEEEANSGKYSVFDIVLPQPGYDIIYPDNESGEFFKTFMGSTEGGELDPHNMRRKHREFSLSGSYRKLLARIGADFGVEVHRYENDHEQFVKTDMDVIREVNGGQKDGQGRGQADMEMEDEGDNQEKKGDKIAVVLKFQLGSSQYATMALRELSKGGIMPYKPDFSGGR